MERFIAPAPDPGGSQRPSSPQQESRPIEDAEVEGYREQDRLLPIANVSRIMRNSLPQDAKISKDAKECVQECVSEFISFITSEASDRCLQEKRKTVNGEDVLWGCQMLGFDHYFDALRVYLAKYRTVLNETGKRSRKRPDDGAEAEKPGRKRRRRAEEADEDEEDEVEEEDDR